MAVAKVILNGNTLIDVTDKTVTSSNLVSPNTALGADGITVTGALVTKSASDVTVSGATTTIPAGVYSSQVQKTVSSGSAATPATTITANPTISVSSGGLITASVSGSQSVTPTVSAGYVSSGTAGTVSVNGSNTSQLTTQAAQTIHPSATDQTIASQRFLTGTQTVKGVLLTNLSAGNIKKDVVIKVGDSTDDDCVTSVTGTYEGSGGAVVAPKKDVNFIDYDGTIVCSYTAQEFAALSAMPANPSHNGLTAQGWNWTLADAKTYVSSYGKLWIGQMYVTESGDTEIDIELHAPRLSPYLGIAVNGTVEVDWGDGTAKSTVTGTSLSTQIRTLHNYSAEGSYTIKIHKVSGSYALSGTTVYSILNGNFSSDNYNRVYANSVQRIRIGNNIATISARAFQYLCSLVSITIPNNITTIGEQAFKHCTSLKSVTIPSDVTSISNYLFNYCTSLKSVSMPSNITGIGGNAFSYCYSLESVTSFSNAFSNCYSLASLTIPSNLTYLYTYAFYYCYSLASITIESNVTTIQGYAFAYCCGLGSIHFKSSTPPTVLSSNAWSNVPTDCIIYVPSGSLSTYTSATNYPSSSTYTYVEE